MLYYTYTYYVYMCNLLLLSSLEGQKVKVNVFYSNIILHLRFQWDNLH